MDDLFNKYKAEIKEDLDLDEFNLKDTQLRLPSIKHKWVARLIEQKIERAKLKELRVLTIDKAIEVVRASSPVSLSDRSARTEAERSEMIQKIDNQIDMCDIIIEYLEKVEVVCRNTTFDIKNVIEIKKQELT